MCGASNENGFHLELSGNVKWPCERKDQRSIGSRVGYEKENNVKLVVF